MTAPLSARLDRSLARAEARPWPWLALSALVLAMQISPLWYATPDGTAYLSIARQVAAGGPLSRLGSAELSFPLGYPLLISPAFLLGERPFLALSIMHWLLAVVFMLGVYAWARRLIGPPALWVTGVVMASVVVWALYRRTLSEAAFLSVMIWAVVAWNALVGALAARRPRAALLAAAGALLAALTMIREAGALFGAGVALALLAGLLRGEVSRRAAALPLAVVAIAALVGVAAIRPERIAAASGVFAGRVAAYADAGAAVTGPFSARLHLRVTEIGQLLMPGMFSAYGPGWVDINTLVYVPLAVIVAVGWWMLVRGTADVLVLTAPFYVALYLAWPYFGGTRYLLPLLPLLVACLWRAYRPLRHWRRPAFALALVAHLGVAAGYWLIDDAPRARACDRQWPAVQQLAARIELDSGAVVAADVSTCVTLMLMLALDRPVQAADGRHVDQSIGWIVTAEPAGDVPGFRAHASAGGYALLRRPD